MGVEKIEHPAKFSKGFTKIFADILLKYDCHKILDPFAGTGKIAEIKKYNWQGEIYANEIEKEWYELCAEHCDVSTMQDAEFLEYLPNSFDAIVTSPTYGNRMADHHKAKDASRRITYTHVIGHDLQDGNTGKMAWGELYRIKHKRIYANICKMVKPNGIFVLNVSNHIRNGKEINVCNFHKDCLEQNGFILIEDIEISTQRNKYGANRTKRVNCEHIYVFKKS